MGGKNPKHCAVMLFTGFVINTVGSHKAPLVSNGVSQRSCRTVQHHTNISHLHIPFSVCTDILNNTPTRAQVSCKNVLLYG